MIQLILVFKLMCIVGVIEVISFPILIKVGLWDDFEEWGRKRSGFIRLWTPILISIPVMCLIIFLENLLF